MSNCHASKWRHGVFLVIEKCLRWAIVPSLRGELFRLFGASIGKNVRIGEIQAVNLSNGFRNLKINDDVFIGSRCLLDLEGSLKIGARTSLSPGVTILTHQDPGSKHGNALLQLYPATISETSIGEDCWIGSNAIILSGVRLGDRVVIAAGSVVIKDVAEGSVAAGVPARVIRTHATA